MALQLHPSLRARLVDLLAQHLPSVQVRNGMFLERLSLVPVFLAQESLPERGPLYEKLRTFVGEHPLVDFVSGVLSRELYEMDKYSSDDTPVTLCALDCFKSASTLADRLVTELDSLPWTYMVSVPLPQPFSEIFCKYVGTFELSDQVAIRSSGDELRRRFPLVSGIKKRDQGLGGFGLLSMLAIGDNGVDWISDRAYLQIKTEGFIGKYVDTEPLIEAQALIRAFCGLAVALRVFNFKRQHDNAPGRERMYIHQRIDEEWRVLDSQELETHHSHTLRQLALHDLDGRLSTDQEKTHWIVSCLHSIRAIFATGGERARRLLLGAQWMFDSLGGSDELLQFVQAAVVMEILLGDKETSDDVGIRKLLANRCAYLIAGTHSEREAIIKDFSEIYSVRSKIVHSGQSRLTRNEYALFNKLRWLGRRVIQNETDLIAKELSTKKGSTGVNS